MRHISTAVGLLFRRSARLFVFERDGWQCAYCKRDFRGYRRRDRLRFLTLDHVVPRSKGGADDASNLAAACLKCNGLKRDRTPEEWARDWKQDGKGVGVSDTIQQFARSVSNADKGSDTRPLRGEEPVENRDSGTPEPTLRR